MKKKLFGLILSGVLALSALTPMTAAADGQKVVTLGADLDEAQKTAVLKYFGILGQNVRTLIITNQDERNHLASYVPLEQIGTHTFSCALVNPTMSGGIQVKTANLNWVTGNMIASTLSTSGVKNCEVLAAAPFEVSGTGALTGVIMAYESASGTTLDPTKKDIATQELVTTTTLATTIGQTDATNIVNEIKIQVIEGEVVDPGEVEEIVEQVVSEEGAVQLSAEDRALLNDLANRIAKQQYDYDEMRETLERVEQNVNVSVNVEQAPINITVSNDANNSSSNTNTNTNTSDNTNTNTSDSSSSAVNENTNENSAENTSSSDSILNSVDENAFGYEVITSTTDQPTEEVQEALGIDTGSVEAQQPAPEDPFTIVSSDSFSVGSETPAPADTSYDNPEQGQIADQTDEWQTTDWQSVETPVDNPEGQYVENPEAQYVENPEAQYVENPEGQYVENPDDQYTENPEGSDVPEPEAPAPVAELVLDDNSVRLLPSQNSNCTGANILRIRVAGKGIQPVADDYGEFGKVLISGPSAYEEITLQDAFDPASYDSSVVAVRDTPAQALAAEGWAEGTDIYINLGYAFAFQDEPTSVYTIDIQNLTLAQTDENGTLIAKGVLNKSENVNVDFVGLQFPISQVSEMTEYGTVYGQIIMPEDAEDGSYTYSAYAESAGITFTMIDNRSFTADLGQAGDASVTIYVSGDGVNYEPFTTVTVPILPQ